MNPKIACGASKIRLFTMSLELDKERKEKTLQNNIRRSWKDAQSTDKIPG